MKRRHLAYIRRGARHLSANFECLDASRPWLCYWTVHSMALLGARIPDDLASE